MEASGDLFEDVFPITASNPDGKRFDRVDRHVGAGELSRVELIVDTASEVFPIKVGERLELCIASTLRLDGKPDSDVYEPDGLPSKLDKYDYGMCGKVFKYEHLPSGRDVAIVASFGGLLMLLRGEQRHLVKISMDQKIYALFRKL